jgi:hypothetical protein
MYTNKMYDCMMIFMYGNIILHISLEIYICLNIFISVYIYIVYMNECHNSEWILIYLYLYIYVNIIIMMNLIYMSDDIS